MDSLFNSKLVHGRENPFSTVTDPFAPVIVNEAFIENDPLRVSSDYPFHGLAHFTDLNAQENLEKESPFLTEPSFSFLEESGVAEAYAAEEVAAYEEENGDDDDDDDHEDDDEVDFFEESSEDSQEEFEALHRDEIRRVSGLGKRKQRVIGGRASGPNEKPEIAKQLQLANGYYIAQQFDKAIEACEAAIQLQPRADRAYNLLGMIAEEKGDMRRALSMYLFMAHIVPREATLWRKLAVFAKLHGTSEEMIICLRKAMFANPKDTLIPWQAIQHYEQLNTFTPQIEFYRHLIKHVPFNMILVRKLVFLLIKKKRERDAFQWLYDALLFHSKNLFSTPWVPPPPSLLQDHILPSSFGVSSLFDRISFRTYHIEDLSSLPLTETTGCATLQDVYLAAYLSIKEGRYRTCLILIKRFFLFLQSQPSNASDDDIEALDDNQCLGSQEHLLANLHDPIKVTQVFTDFHTLLGLCRLHLNQEELSERHFQYLFALPYDDYALTYQLMLGAYYYRHLYDTALNLIDSLLLSKPADVLYLWILRSLCFLKLDRVLDATLAIQKAMELDPDSHTARSVLAQVYRKEGRYDVAAELMSKVHPSSVSISSLKQWLMDRYPECKEEWLSANSSSSSCSSSSSSGTSLTSGTPNEDQGSGGEESSLRKSSKSSSERSRRAIAHERMRIMACKEAEMKSKFETLVPLWSQFETLSEKSQLEILSIAKSIFLVFSNTEAFYPSSRSTTFTGLDSNGRLRSSTLKNTVLNQDEEYQLVARRTFLAPRANYDPEEFQELTKGEFFYVQANSFLGLSFDTWFETMMQYCIALVKAKQSDLAFQALEHISESNVYWHNDQKMFQLHLIGMALGVASSNVSKTVQYSRWLMSHYPYRCDMYRIYCAALSSGYQVAQLCSSAPQQKYLRRILLQRFGGPLRKHMTPLEVEKYGKHRFIPVKDVPERIWVGKPALLMIFAHSMSYSGSFKDALSHYLKAYALVPHDPLLNFQIGLMHLHRSMQRVTENRHMHIAHAFTFLFRYAELAKSISPLSLIHYNLGRAFHQIHLLNYATKYYRSALHINDCPFILKETAYNLSLIYIQTQSIGLAKKIMQQYLTI